MSDWGTNYLKDLLKKVENMDETNEADLISKYVYKLSKTSNGTYYIADHESRPKQFKFENGRRVWITNEGYLDTDFGHLESYSESTISDKLKNALENAPVHRLGETESNFIERYKEWYRTTRRESLNL